MFEYKDKPDPRRQLNARETAETMMAHLAEPPRPRRFRFLRFLWKLWCHDPVFRLLLIATWVICSIAFTLGTLEGRAERACLRHGFPEVKLTWAGLGESFCVKRVDQTDVVVPLESL